MSMVKTISHHSYLVRRKSQPFPYAIEHRWVRLSQSVVRNATRSALKTSADGATIHQNGLLVGRAHLIGVSSQISHTLGNPPRGATEPFVTKGHIERSHDDVRHVLGAILAGDETCLLELAYHRRRTQQEELSGRRIIGPNVIDGRDRGRIHLLFGGRDAHLGQFGHIVGERLGWIVSQKRVCDSHLRQRVQEIERKWKKRVAQVYGAIHIQSNMLDI